MGLCFIFWSIAFVYISMLTSCLAPQNTPDLIQAWLAGNRHHNKQSDGFWKLRFPLLLYVRSSAQLSLFKMVFFSPPHISLVSWLNPDAHMLHVHRRTTLDHGNDRTGWSITENPGQWFDKRGLIRNHFNNLLHNMHITGVFWPSSLVLRTSFSFLFFF